MGLNEQKSNCSQAAPNCQQLLLSQVTCSIYKDMRATISLYTAKRKKNTNKKCWEAWDEVKKATGLFSLQFLNHRLKICKLEKKFAARVIWYCSTENTTEWENQEGPDVHYMEASSLHSGGVRGHRLCAAGCSMNTNAMSPHMQAANKGRGLFLIISWL